MKKSLKSKRNFRLALCVLFLACILVHPKNVKATYEENALNYNSASEKNNNSVLKDNISQEGNVLFLSDIPYMKAQVGWGTIALDKTQDNTSLSMLINGSTTVVKKGIWAHATSTVEYDISKYKDYAYFTTYYGLNSTSGNNGNGVKFYIYTSEDGKTWTLRTEENPVAIKSSNNAIQVKIDIRNANYIRLYANDNGANGSDHAVWGDAKLIKEGYNGNVMTTVEEFDEILKAAYARGPIKSELNLTLLQRDFINRVGQYQLRIFLEANPKNRETLEWFLNDEEALRLWTIGGTPDGTYLQALQVLSNVYQAHKEDLANENLTPNGTKYKDLYLKMMLSLSLSHSTKVGLWIGGNQFSNAVTRYEIYKQMHLDNKLGSNAMFESYTIEEMRAVMFTNIDDEEILWLRDYSEKKFSAADRFNPYKYIKYTLSYSYYKPQYYSQANYEKWNQKYDLAKYNITYQSGKPKLWIVFEEGAVCGGLSKTAANLYGVWGYPAKVLGQPQHAAYAYLYNAGGGNYAWQLAYNVVATGWANTGGGGRMPNGWGNRYATSNGSIQPGSYHFLSQQAQNEYDKYEKSELILLQEDIYKNDLEKLEQIYRDALQEEIINLDAWIGLVNIYLTDTTKTEADAISLAEEIAEVMTYHPLPMFDLTNRLGKKITSPEYRGKMMMIQEQTLRKATKATSANTLYHKEVPVVANAILGVVDSSIGNFSFDGANAGKIVLSKQLQSAQVNWSYSLDGGNTWKDCYEHSVQLTSEEIASINVNNDIKIHISGLPMTAANIYTIDITKRTFPNGVISINDEEDRILNARSDMEWTLDPNSGWNSFANTNPLFSGNVRVYVRVIATGTQIASDPVYFTFKENNSNDEKWYIQSKNLQVVEVNASGAGKWGNILDGNINTYWRSKDGFMPAYVTIKMDQPRYVSGLDYVPDKSAKKFGMIPYGRAANINIYVSMDNKNWELAFSKNNIGNNDNLKHFDFKEPKEALYVKFECKSVYEGDYNLLAVSVIKLYENVIVNKTPRAEVNYNITKKTNQDVTAELINETRNITVTNNDGKKTHTFTQNGEFTFEFVDDEGNKGTAAAKVDWIDKEVPTAEVVYSTTELTNEDVVATITFDKPNIKILSEDVQIAENPVDKSKTITFENNASYELRFEDELGNIGTKTIAVDWIDKEAPTAELTYSSTHLTDKPVTVTIKPSEEVTITNNDGNAEYTFTKNGTFTFEFVDNAGNTGTATASVNWISKVPEYTLTYSTKELTNKDVTVTLEIEEGYAIVSNNGNNVYTFTENGKDNFEYMDESGNRGMIPISVDWIDKEAPTAELIYSTNNATDKPVTVTMNPSEEVTVTNNNGSMEYTFTENGTFTFEFVDKVGNTGSATANVTWISKEVKVPEYTLTYSTKELTNQDVTVTLEIEEGYTIVNNNGNNVYTFTENGKDNFEYMDQNGNKGLIPISVDWIDKKAPTAEIEFNITSDTDQNVIATLKPSEEVTVTNNNGSMEHTFTENGTFTYEFMDKAGNTGTATAKVTWINKKQDEEFMFDSEKYEIKEGYISNIRAKVNDKAGTTVKEFKENIKTNQTIKIVNKDNVEIQDNELIKTGLKLIVGEKQEYTLIVKGDIDGNGAITLTDLAKMKLHSIGKEILEGNALKAADMNETDTVTLTDLARIKLVLIGLITLE